MASILTVILLATFGFGAYDTYQVFQLYQRVEGQVHAGVAELDKVQVSFKEIRQDPLDAAAISGVASDLAAAHSDFLALQVTLHSIGNATGFPVVGGKLASALRLAPLAVDGTQAAMLACQSAARLVALVSNPLDPAVAGLSSADLDTLQSNLAQIGTLFVRIAGRVDLLQPQDLTLDPHLAPLVDELRLKEPLITQALGDLQAVVAGAGPLLGVGTPARYLLEILDSTELRPGGGFIGSYGFLTLDGGRLAPTNPLSITDVDLLDVNVKYGNQVIPIPSQYSWFTTFSRWGFRDSNLDADFPTDARNAEQLYRLEGGTVAVQGVIAITPWLIQKALAIIGPVSIPELHTTVTADNLIQQIHYNQLTAGVAGGPDTILDPTTGTSLRKHFTGLLFQHFLAQVKQTEGQHLGALVQLLAGSVQTKDLQAYFNNPIAEGVLRDYHVASTIDAPAQGDSLFVVDANIVASKANYFVHQAMDDEVTLAADGSATHHLSLTYTFPTGPDVLAETFAANDPAYYVSYLRVYVPPGATLQSVAGWTITSRTAAFGRLVWGGQFTLRYGERLTISLAWTVPSAAAVQGAGHRVYAEEQQHQAGITWQVTQRIHLPACARFTDVGQPLAASSPQLASVQGALTEDQRTTLRYSTAGC